MFVRCPVCNTMLDVPAHAQNAEVKCGKCGATFSPNFKLQSESPQSRTNQYEMVFTADPLKAVFPLSGLDATTLAFAALSIFVGWLPIIGTVISLIAMIMGTAMLFRRQTDRLYHIFVAIPAAVVPCIALLISVTPTAFPIAKASGLLDSQKGE